MGGKASILLVLGFSLIFLVVGHNFNQISLRSVGNSTNYYLNTKAYNIAVSGANMAANQIFMDKTWVTGYSNLSFDGGTVNVYVSNNISLTGKTILCHVPPGNPANRHTISVGSAGAVNAHLSHGDYLGVCTGDTLDTEMATIISEGTYQGITKIVIVELRPSYYSKFGNYYSSISAAPATGDTFQGPFHVNAKLTTYGTPVFWGKVTNRTGLTKNGSPKDPKFYGGYETGVDLPLQFDTTGMRNLAATGGKFFRDTTNTGKAIEVRLYFNSNGTVTYSTNNNNTGWNTPRTQALSTLAPNGMIYVEKGNIYTKGAVNGAITIVSTKKGASGKGNVYQEDDLYYADNPVTNPNSTNVLGIVAEENIRIKSNAATLGGDVITQASMFSLNQNVGPEDGLVSQNFLGSWRILGGIIANTTRVTATYATVDGVFQPIKGLRFVHTYDNRFMTYVPPNFPHTQNYEIVSWYE
ncbi:MAG: hypothetical protein V1773_13595 [bacterium]